MRRSRIEDRGSRIEDRGSRVLYARAIQFSILYSLSSILSVNGAAPPITALAFTPDGKTVVVGSQAGLELRTWPELQQARTLPTKLDHVHDLAFAPDGKTLAAVGGTPAKRGMVELYRWPEGTLLHRMSPHRDLIYAVSWRADSAVFATASADRTVSIHESATAKTLRDLEGHSRGVLAVVFLPGEEGLATAGIDESLRLWDASNGQLLRTFPNHTGPVHDLKVRPGGDREGPPLLASVSDDRTVRLWQPTLGRMMRFVRLKSAPLAVAWTADGRTLLTPCKDGRLRVIDPDTVEVVEDLPALDGIAYSIAVAPDGSILIGGQNGQLRRLQIERSPRPDPPSAIRNGKIELLRDTWGVPHIFAESDAGALYGLGYAVAEDRGFQMYYNLRMIQGRLAELIGNRPSQRPGETALLHDQKMRTFGFYRAACAVADKLDTQTRALLQAYCDGVNAYFASHCEQLHPLFAQLDLQPKPWTPACCIASWWHLGQFFATDGTHEL
jgi:WD40 repeat protein